MGIAHVLEADLTWTGAAFESGLRLVIGDDGNILEVGRGGPPVSHRLTRHALLPGFVNAHSHAFQIGLRGSGERYDGGSGDFWSWREAMYEMVEALDDEAFYELSLRAFREMRSAGITSVGEFHYFHHGRDSADFRFDSLVLAAAAQAGLRIVLLEGYYRTGGIGRPLAGGQRRFATPDLDSYWRQLDRLAAETDPRTQSLGVVAHSIRAADPDEIAALYAEAERRGLPFHIHVEEQRQEIEACLEAYSRPPMELLNSRLEVSPRLTAVHCTHTDVRDMERFLERGGRVCLCPLTEAALADGIPDVPGILAADGAVCLGTDCNARISMTEEARWLEYVQRLTRRRRGVVRGETGDVAATLLRFATENGADALGLRTGRIAAGYPADLLAIDLDHPVLGGPGPTRLAAAILFGGAEAAITATAIGGHWLEHA